MQDQSPEDVYIDRMEWEKQLLNPELDEPSAEAASGRPVAPPKDIPAADEPFRRSHRAVLFDLIDEGGWGVAGYPIDD